MDSNFAAPAPSPQAPLGTFQIWTQALVNPTEETYQRIIDDPRATLSRSLLWIGAAQLISITISVLLSAMGIGVNIPLLGLEGGENADLLGGLLAGSIVGLLCLIPVVVLAGLAGFLISAGLVHFIAGALGGQGKFNELANGIAAYATPMSLIISASTLVPFIGPCLVFPLSLYGLYLHALVIKTAHRLGWGSAIATMVILVVIVALVLGVCFLLLVGPFIQELINNPHWLDPSLIP
jgi:hypothetical protein